MHMHYPSCYSCEPILLLAALLWILIWLVFTQWWMYYRDRCMISMQGTEPLWMLCAEPESMRASWFVYCRNKKRNPTSPFFAPITEAVLILRYYCAVYDSLRYERKWCIRIHDCIDWCMYYIYVWVLTDSIFLRFVHPFAFWRLKICLRFAYPIAFRRIQIFAYC